MTCTEISTGEKPEPVIMRGKRKAPQKRELYGKMLFYFLFQIVKYIGIKKITQADVKTIAQLLYGNDTGVL